MKDKSNQTVKISRKIRKEESTPSDLAMRRGSPRDYQKLYNLKKEGKQFVNTLRLLGKEGGALGWGWWGGFCVVDE